MSSKIYTKTGDIGTTSLIGGTKVSKSDTRIEAYGTVDELNAFIGLCRDIISDDESRKVLLEIQDRLFTIGSSLACDPVKEPKMRLPDLKTSDIALLENEIDRMDDVLLPMKHFILPGGHSTLSQLHIARCVCRRAERCCVRLETETPGEDPIILQYLNRLSDYLFMLCRYTGHLMHIAEIAWRPRM